MDRAIHETFVNALYAFLTHLGLRHTQKRSVGLPFQNIAICVISSWK